MISTNEQAIDALKQVALAGIQEQRRARRWNILFRFIFILLAFSFVMISAGILGGISQLGSSKSSSSEDGEAYVAQVSVTGTIMDGQAASASNLVSALQDAFEDEDAKGVIIRCNSPGGSPVQSSQIYNEIIRLRSLYPEKPVYAVAEDVCASGGYYIIAAAQKIFANESSLVGSIGVRMDSFGFVEIMKKLGVESRQITAGENKALLDPFKPQQASDVAYLEKLLANTHEHFIRAVKAGRGERIDTQKNPELFTGLFWSGDQAKDIGLVDGFGSVETVAREELGVEVVVDYTVNDDIFERLSKRLGASLTSVLVGMQNTVLR